MTEPTARTWDTFAGIRVRRDGTEEFADFFEHPGLVRMSGHETAHPVTLTEDADGDLLGWIDANDPDRIAMIEHKKIFAIQFPNGVQVEIDRDHGEVVPVRAVARKPAPEVQP